MKSFQLPILAIVVMSILALVACGQSNGEVSEGTSPQLTSGYDPFGPDRDCGDFSSHRKAQDFYKAAGGPASDRHRLDADRDGIACEALR